MSDRLRKSIVEMADGLYRAGIMDRETLREFDPLRLPPVEEMSAGQIKSLRLRSKTSQAVFAAYLNTSVSTVQKWEQGLKQPGGTALRLLNLVNQKGLEAIL